MCAEGVDGVVKREKIRIGVVLNRQRLRPKSFVICEKGPPMQKRIDWVHYLKVLCHQTAQVSVK